MRRGPAARALPGAAVHARGLRPRRRRGAVAWARPPWWSTHRTTPRSSCRGRRQRRDRRARPSRTTSPPRSCASTRPASGAAPSTADWFERNAQRFSLESSVADGARRPTPAAETVHVAVNLLHLVPGETGGAEIVRAPAAPGPARGGRSCASSCARRRGRRAERSGRRRGRPALGSTRAAASGAYWPSRPCCRPRCGRRAPTCCTTSSTRRPRVSPVPQVTTIHDVIYKRYPGDARPARPGASRCSCRSPRGGRAESSPIPRRRRPTSSSFSASRRARRRALRSGPGIAENVQGPDAARDPPPLRGGRRAARPQRAREAAAQERRPA